MVNIIEQKDISFAPLISQESLYILLAVSLVLVAFFLIFKHKTVLLRSLGLLIICLAIALPSTLSLQKTPKPAVAVIAVDKSYSNSIDVRTQQTTDALEQLKEKLDNIDGLEYVVVSSSPDKTYKETEIFKPISDAYSNIPPKQRAGTIVISDGHVHDLPTSVEKSVLRERFGPVHHIITGRDQENDRRLEILKAPLYGLKGSRARVEYIIHDSKGKKHKETVDVTVKSPNGEVNTFKASTGSRQITYLYISNTGANPYEISVSAYPDEISAANNRRALIIQGIREKLNVLLVSGAPHEGGRYWRSLLTSDPSVELVHFTILRDLKSRDNTPRSQMALIPFPHQQLFHKQLNNFDLIIFDRYRNQGILQKRTYQNIVNFVKNGGALLIASGPEYTSKASIFNTPLNNILVGEPSNDVFERAYVPTISEQGKRHPITRNLKNDYLENDWAPWLRQIKVQNNGADILMQGHNETPLVLIKKVQEGRLIHLTSDQIWLWARGYEQGGPYMPLMRNMIHWLLKEPHLEEGLIELSITGDKINVKRYIDTPDAPLNYTDPESNTHTVELKPSPDKYYRASIDAKTHGLYSFSSGENNAYIVKGEYDSLEQTNFLRTPDKLKELTRLTGGKTYDAKNISSLKISLLSGNNNSKYHSFNTLGLKQSEYSEVLNKKYAPLLPDWAYLLLLSGLLLFIWHRESK